MLKGQVRSRILLILMFCCLAGLLIFNIVTLQAVKKVGASAKETAAAVGNLDYTLQNMGEDLSDACADIQPGYRICRKNQKRPGQ